jgi:cytochrome subunit of sulfide dehydrogenase
MFGAALLTALLAALLVFGNAFAAGAGETAACDACHGPGGISTRQNVPSIAGISVPVQLDALKAFKARTRPCRKVPASSGRTEDMCEVAAGLTEAQMMSLANHYSSLPYSPMKQSVDAGEAAAGKAIAMRDCEICHTKGGTDPTDDAGLLGGQPLGWLESAIADMKDAKSPQPKMMRSKTSKLSQADVTALAAYYASL